MNGDPTRIDENTATRERSWVAYLDIDEVEAQAAASVLGECLDPSAASLTVFEIAPGRWRVGIYLADDMPHENVRELVRNCLGAHAAQALAFEPIALRDWVAESLAGLSPVVAGRFVVHGAHDRGRLPPHRIAIEIEAALAFGTGHHATTRGCLLALDRWLKSRRPRQTRVLDVGTGTGVLAIAAAKAIGRSVLANDIDAAAIAIARENARANGVGPRVAVVHASGVRARTLALERYDLVFANILLSPLKRIAAALAGRTAVGGTLVLSGLLRDQANAALAAYRLQGLRLRWRIELDGWTTLCLTRAGARAQKSRPDQDDRDRR